MTLVKNLLPQDGCVQLCENFVAPKTATELFERISHNTPWRHDTITLFGKRILQPRYTSWHGDAQKRYTYSGLTLEPQPWTEELVFLRKELLERTGHEFNSALLNLYRDQKDSMGWHRDNEKELGPNPVIASLSFGESRDFYLRHVKDKDLKIQLTLKHGSLVLMSQETQTFWEHSLPKRTRPLRPRLNITFRYVL
jgi:alkylated DNA repair dioxygenase AlkB